MAVGSTEGWCVISLAVDGAATLLGLTPTTLPQQAPRVATGAITRAPTVRATRGRQSLPLKKSKRSGGRVTQALEPPRRMMQVPPARGEHHGFPVLGTPGNPLSGARG
jgi:hypothetical protein